MKAKPSLEEFRNGGGEMLPETRPPAPRPDPISERVNKTIRLRKAFEGKLKEDAFHRTMAGNRRVTESDIIDEALEAYFATKK